MFRTNIQATSEGLYSVVVSNFSGSVTSAPAALWIDADGDGLPDTWEVAHFGNLTSRQGGGDADGDGISNRDEFEDGTDPANASSFRPRLTLLGPGGTVAATPAKVGYDPGESVTLAAAPFVPNTFHGWTGDLTGTVNPAVLAMTGNKSVQARFGCTVAPADLVAFWRGEADATDTIGGHHGSSYDGASAVGPSVTASGKAGGAFTFSGGLHVRIPDAPDLRPARLTVEAWVFPTVQNASLQTILSSGSSVNDVNAWLLGLQFGRAQFLSSHGSMQQLEVPSAIPLNQWTHLAITFDGSAKRMYTNGLLASSSVGYGPMNYDPGSVPVTIGSDWVAGASAQRFAGRIDEVSLYRRALSADELLGIVRGGMGGKCVALPYFTSPQALPDGRLDLSYSRALTTVLGAAPVVFSVSGGALPEGMSVAGDGTISGVPTAAGDFVFAVQATDAVGSTAEQIASLRILPPLTPFGLVAWWRAESDAQDAAGLNHGVPKNGATFAAGRVGTAFAFDGVNDYVEVPDSPGLRPAAISLEAWVFPTAPAATHQTILARGSASNDDNPWWMGLFSGQPRFWTKHVGGGNVHLTGLSALPTGQWSHLVMSFDGSTKRLYVNGVQAAFVGGLSALAYDAAVVPVTLGSDWVSGGRSQHFPGRIDEASIYQRTLTAAEVAAIYAEGSRGKDATGPYFNALALSAEILANQPYAYTFPTIRGTAPIVFTVSSGALPPGVVLSAGGSLSGTPTVPGRFSFVVRATDGEGLFAEQAGTLVVSEAIPPPYGLVGWWRAEGNGQDALGANHGTLRNGASTGPGRVGLAFVLDGSNDSVDVPDAPALRPTSLTVEAWVAFDTVGTQHQIVGKPVGGGVGDSFGIWLHYGVLKAAVASASGFGTILSHPLAPIVGRWYHVAYSYDAITQEQVLYVDGARVAVGTANKVIGYDAQPFLIGRDTDTGIEFHYTRGRVDEVSLYNRALAEVEVLALFDAGFAGKTSAGPYFDQPEWLPGGGVGRSYSYDFAAVRGTAPVTYALTGGTLPDGLTLRADGALTGTPLLAGTSAFEVRATDVLGRASKREFTLTVRTPVAPPPGIVAWYRAEGTADDAVGAHNGTPRNGAAFAAGRVEQGFLLDGVDDLVDAPDAPGLRPASVTVEAWIQPGGGSGRRVILAKPLGSGATDSYAVWLDDGVVRAAVADGTGPGPVLSAPLVPAPGRWYHVAYTFDEGTRQQALYLDGVEVAGGMADKTIQYDVQPLMLGAGRVAGGAGAWYAGRIDEATVYARALSYGEVEVLHEAGVAGKTTEGPYFAVLPLLPKGYTGSAYSFGITSARGAAPVSYSLIDGGLPSGLTLSPAGVVAGTATEFGHFVLGVRAADGGGRRVEQEFTLEVGEGLTPVPSPPGLVAWWRAEGNALDSRGSSTGTLKNGAGFGTGEVGQAFQFDGLTRHVEVTDSSAVNFNGTMPMSVELWAYRTGLGAVMSLVGKGVDCGAAMQYEMAFDVDGLRFGGAGGRVVTGLHLPVNIWVHLAATFDGGTLRFYANGVPVGAAAGVTLGPATAAPLRLGRSAPCSTGFAGLLDEVAIHRRALSAGEVASIYHAKSAGKIPPLAPAVVGRLVFYNQSAWDGNTAGADVRDDNAIATDKTALRTAVKATFANYTGYTRGINGIMVDIADLPAGAGPGVADFGFRVGNNNSVGEWVSAPLPSAGGGVTVRRGAGMGGSDRITLVWGADAVTKKWLQVRVKASVLTGLTVDDVFYFGNAIGETGNQPGLDAIVNASDEILVRNNPRNLFTPAAVSFPYDHNRDKQVNATDQIAARLSTTSAFTALRLITPSTVGSPAPAGLGAAVPGPAAGGEPDAAGGLAPAPEREGRSPSWGVTESSVSARGGAPLGVVVLDDGRIVVHARQLSTPGLRLEMTTEMGDWAPAPFESSSFRDGESYWLLGPPAVGQSRFFRLSGP